MFELKNGHSWYAYEIYALEADYGDVAYGNRRSYSPYPRIEGNLAKKRADIESRRLSCYHLERDKQSQYVCAAGV
jgi:tetrahydromethanopterin S-methyltransferase subunit E